MYKDDLEKYENEDFVIDEADEDELEDDIGDISDFEDEPKENKKDEKFKKKLPMYVAIGGFLMVVGLLAIPGIIKNSAKKNKNQNEMSQNMEQPVYDGEADPEEAQNKNLNLGNQNDGVVNANEPCDTVNLNNPNNINNPNCANILNSQNLSKTQNEGKNKVQEGQSQPNKNFETQDSEKNETQKKTDRNASYNDKTQVYSFRNIPKPVKPEYQPRNITKPSSGALNSLSKNGNSSVNVDKSDKNDKSVEKKIRPKAKANGINTFSLQQGSYIPIVTSTRMNSDTPSYFMAIVSENVYSKDGHHKILIPMGSKIIGNYSALKNNNDTRMLMMVDKIILPNNKTIVFEKSNVIDLKGEIGAKGKLNTKMAQRLGKSLLALSFSVADLVLDYRKTRIVRRYPSRWDEIITDPVNTVKDSMETIDKAWNSVKNRIKIPVGTKLNVFTGNEIVLEEYKRS
ncbi:TrbI/VirB10 family protein [Leptotrichia sp. oral taxon 847]|uniref:TrbI/VirB10 family protein n=1 Tax=Leptotrichia sp. oral taxon 847 TaxID=1785996 RepID=UPI000767F756|nr:TrbI/VirB10 family protein [Leptotrichia sp. oral taxon 847]AMD94812.1 hypothetical protein AXF11_03875 [Leptotrichia sp. oral taxon 847]